MELAPDCLAAILGLGRARLQKAARGELDKRFAELGGGIRYAPKMGSVDRFLLELHGSVAETLPTEPPCGTSVQVCGFVSWIDELMPLIAQVLSASKVFEETTSSTEGPLGRFIKGILQAWLLPRLGIRCRLL